MSTKYQHSATITHHATVVTFVCPPISEVGMAILGSFLYPNAENGFGVVWIRRRSFVIDNAGLQSVESFSQHTSHLMRCGLVVNDYDTFKGEDDNIGLRLTKEGHAVVRLIGGIE